MKEPITGHATILASLFCRSYQPQPDGTVTLNHVFDRVVATAPDSPMECVLYLKLWWPGIDAEIPIEVHHIGPDGKTKRGFRGPGVALKFNPADGPVGKMLFPLFDLDLSTHGLHVMRVVMPKGGGPLDVPLEVLPRH
jgi:hypothetical protein